MEEKYSWRIFLGYLVFSLAKSFGTEFWFRGYILPRQESASGTTAWLLHGILYTLFFLFMPWYVIAFALPCFALPFVAQKLKNTWPGIIAQFVSDVPLLFMIASRIT
jgi:hypothetical protein